MLKWNFKRFNLGLGEVSMFRRMVKCEVKGWNRINRIGSRNTLSYVEIPLQYWSRLFYVKGQNW